HNGAFFDGVFRDRERLSQIRAAIDSKNASGHVARCQVHIGAVGSIVESDVSHAWIKAAELDVVSRSVATDVSSLVTGTSYFRELSLEADTAGSANGEFIVRNRKERHSRTRVGPDETAVVKGLRVETGSKRIWAGGRVLESSWDGCTEASSIIT